MSKNLCDCEKFVQKVDIPGKVIILVCKSCKTQYTFYPNGEIAYETQVV